MVRWWIFIRFIVLIMLFSFPNIGALAGAADINQDMNTDITILSINDFHGALLEGGKNPGAAKVAKYLKDEKSHNPEGTIIVSAGDMFQGSPDSNLLYGKTVVDVMNSIGFDAMTLGNHEFDWGLTRLKERIAQSHFPYLSANIIDLQTGSGIDFVKPYIIIEKNGVKVGIIGLATPETAYTTNPKIVSGYHFLNAAQAVNTIVPELKRQGAELILVLAHLACDVNPSSGEITGDAAELAKAVTGVDVIITGHSHTKLAGKVNDISIVQAAYNGRAVGEVIVTYSEKEKKIMGITEKVVDLPVEGLVEDEQVKEIINKAEVDIAPVKNIILGKTLTDLNHEKKSTFSIGTMDY